MNASRLEGAVTFSTLARAYFRRRYQILFYSLLATMAAGPLLKTAGLGSNVLEVLLAINLLAAVAPLARGTGGKLLLIVLIALWSLRWGAAWLDYPGLAIIGLALWTIIALLAAAAALRFALRATSVDREHLYAAADAYVLAGVFLGVFYWVLDRTWPTSLVFANERSEEVLTLASGIYFSFVTLATLGYGDIVPHSEPARGLAIVEAVAGQLYLAVMIAHLVSLHVRGAARD
jgi:voltage-gated potassium channel Kch